MIELTGVGKIYHTARGEVRALDDVSLRIEPGEFVAVRGPSGCGKSTLLSLVGGLARPTKGRVIVAGTDLAPLSPQQRAEFRRTHVGFVFQMFHLLPYLNVLDNVLVAGGADSRTRATELLHRFGLAARMTHRPSQLSAGERQRVAVARALLNAPKVLLADEPTGNLDGASAAIVLDLLGDFQRAGGTVLLVTHDDQAARHAQRTISMQAGKVVEPRPAPCAAGSR